MFPLQGGPSLPTPAVGDWSEEGRPGWWWVGSAGPEGTADGDGQGKQVTEGNEVGLDMLVYSFKSQRIAAVSSHFDKDYFVSWVLLCLQML